MIKYYLKIDVSSPTSFEEIKLVYAIVTEPYPDENGKWFALGRAAVVHDGVRGLRPTLEEVRVDGAEIVEYNLGEKV